MSSHERFSDLITFFDLGIYNLLWLRIKKAMHKI